MSDAIELPPLPDPALNDREYEIAKRKHFPIEHEARYPGLLFVKVTSDAVKLTMPEDEAWQPGTILLPAPNGHWAEWKGERTWGDLPVSKWRALIVWRLTASDGPPGVRASWTAEAYERGVLVKEALPTFKIAAELGMFKGKITEQS